MISDDHLMLDISDRSRPEVARKAFEELFQRYGGVVLGYCMRLLQDRNKAEDLTQEIWVKVVTEATRYEANGKFRAWLLTISRNFCFNALKAERRHLEVEMDQSVEMDLHGALDFQSGAAFRNEFLADDPEDRDRAALKVKFDRLPEAQRVALALLVIEELSYDQIAHAMGIHVGNVKTLIHRARKTLQGSFAKRGRE